jgi:hypothetical protein
VVEVEGGIQDDLVARRGDRLHGMAEGHVRARGHHQVPAAPHVDTVFRQQLRANAFEQLRHARTLLVFVR